MGHADRRHDIQQTDVSLITGDGHCMRAGTKEASLNHLLPTFHAFSCLQSFSEDVLITHGRLRLQLLVTQVRNLTLEDTNQTAERTSTRKIGQMRRPEMDGISGKRPLTKSQSMLVHVIPGSAD